MRLSEMLLLFLNCSGQKEHKNKPALALKRQPLQSKAVFTRV